MRMEEFVFPEKVLYILEELEKYGEGYLVGGSVRDILLGREVHDFDFCTNLSYETLKQIFSKYFCIETGKAFGVLRLRIDGEEFEIARFRSEKGSDGRRPEEVTFVKRIEEDLARRDFTINAMAYNQEKGLLDYYDAQKDLDNKIIRFIGNPRERIQEDGLRIMRAFRFMSQLGFSLESNTKKAIMEEKEMLGKIAKSRITEEWNKLILGDFVVETLEEMKETGVLERILLSLKSLYHFNQNNPYHCYDLWEHTMQVVKYVPKDLDLRLAAIFHDIGKPLTKTIDEKTGYYHFYGHEKKGAERIRSILQDELEESNKTRKEVEFLIENHMILHRNSSEKGIKKLISHFGIERTEKLIKLSIADNLGKNLQQLRENNVADLFYKIVEKQKIPTLQELAIDGFALMKLGYQGKEIQKIKEYLLEEILEGKIENKETALLSKVKELHPKS